MKCCNEECRTRFCPHCGKEVNHYGALSGLLLHCRRQEKYFTARLAKGQRLWPNAVHGFASTKRDLAKWKGWADALQALLEKTEEGQA